MDRLLKQLPSVRTDVDYIKFVGGVDLSSPALSIKPGNAADSLNYEPGVFNGYKRIDGIERFDGRPSPSSAVYYMANVTVNGVATIGDNITGIASNASGIVAAIDGDNLILTKVEGEFQIEPFNGSITGNILAKPLRGGYSDGLADATALSTVADVYRQDIGKPNSSSNPIRGVWLYKGNKYCFQDAGAQCHMYKATSSGWQRVNLGIEIEFTSATAEPAINSTIVGAISGATARIKRVVLESGAYNGGTGQGRYIIYQQTGTFINEPVNTAQVSHVSEVTGNSSAITLLSGGRYEFDNYNFTGNTDTLRMYGCDGVNHAFEFDGDIFVQLRTGMPEDKPSHVISWKHHLFLSFKGSVQNSAIGNAYKWTAITGSAEIGLGDDIVGFRKESGDVLPVYARNSTFQISGTSSADFQLTLLAPEVGAIPYTIQNLGNRSYGLDDRGIIELSRAQEFGNFNSATLSRMVQPLINRIRPIAVASSVYKERNEYRLYGNNGTGLIMTTENDNFVGIMPFDYNAGRTNDLINITCACSGEDADGKDVIFLGADNGFVYQADKGSSFDGNPIQAFLRMPFNNLKSPRHTKEYMRGIVEMTCSNYSEIRFQPEFSYSDPNVQAHVLDNLTIQGSGGYWDIANWDEFFYDSQIIVNPEINITGQGLNMSIIFYSFNNFDLGHTLYGALIHYIVRSLRR